MDTHEKPGHSPGKGLRRRIVFELEEGQLPLLEVAEARHGSKRAALIAALQAEAGQEEGAKAKGKAKGHQKNEATARTKLEGELAEARKQLDAAGVELQELRTLAVDRLYCERCGEWVEQEEWRWVNYGTGAYAYHEACGDYGEDPDGSSWLALRC